MSRFREQLNKGNKALDGLFIGDKEVKGLILTGGDAFDDEQPTPAF